MRDLEKAIVRLGRQGRTDDALSLYRAVWSLDAERQRIRQQTQQNNSNENTNGDLALATIVRKSSLRPTTRLMNVAIDACARALPTSAKSMPSNSSVPPPPVAVASPPTSSPSAPSLPSTETPTPPSNS